MVISNLAFLTRGFSLPGSMSGRAFLTKLLEPVVDKISLEMADDDDKTVVGELTRRAAAGRVLVLIGEFQI